MRTSYCLDSGITHRHCFLLTAILITSITHSMAQIIYPPGRIDANIRPGGLVIPVEYASKNESEREEYLNDAWHKGTIILLTGDSIHQYPLKYNLTTDAVEIKTKNAVKVVPLNKVRRFYWVQNEQRSEYINSSGYTMMGTPLTGYLQLLSTGTLNLFKKTYLNIQKANYRPELDVGSTEDKTIRKEEYYVARGTDILKIKKKNKVYDFFRQHRPAVKKYAQRNDLQPKNEEDLIAVVDYYNQLVE